MVAAFGNLQVAVMARGELEARLGHQIEIGRRHRRRSIVDRVDDLLVLVCAGDREHLREAGADDFGLLAHTAGDDDPAVLRDRLADRLQALLLGGIEEAAGVDEHHVRAFVIGRHGIALRTQFREDALGVDEVLRAAERNHADARRGGENGGHGSGGM